jgi:hypothetical protein
MAICTLPKIRSEIRPAKPPARRNPKICVRFCNLNTLKRFRERNSASDRTEQSERVFPKLSDFTEKLLPNLKSPPARNNADSTTVRCIALAVPVAVAPTLAGTYACGRCRGYGYACGRGYACGCACGCANLRDMEPLQIKVIYTELLTSFFEWKESNRS